MHSAKAEIKCKFFTVALGNVFYSYVTFMLYQLYYLYSLSFYCRGNVQDILYHTIFMICDFGVYKQNKMEGFQQLPQYLDQRENETQRSSGQMSVRCPLVFDRSCCSKSFTQALIFDILLLLSFQMS